MGRVVTNKDHPLGFVSDTFSFKEGGVVPCYECMHKRQEGGPGVITSPLGQWAYPGQVTRIPSNNITMQGVNYPVLGVDNMGYKQMMFPGGQYSFPGTSVTEYPIMQRGGPSQFKDIRKVDQMTGRPVTHKNKKNLVLTPDIYQNYINPAIEAARRFNPDPKDKNFVRNFVAQGLIESAYGTAKSAIHNAEQNPWQIQYYYHPELAGEGGREQSIYDAAHLAAENYKRYKNKPEAYKVQAYNGLTPQMKKDPKYGKHVQSVRDSVLKPSGMFDYIDNYQPAPRVQVMPALKPIKKQGEEEDILTRFTRGVFGFFGKELPKEADGGPVWSIVEKLPKAQMGLQLPVNPQTGMPVVNLPEVEVSPNSPWLDRHLRQLSKREDGITQLGFADPVTIGALAAFAPFATIPGAISELASATGAGLNAPIAGVPGASLNNLMAAGAYTASMNSLLNPNSALRQSAVEAGTNPNMNTVPKLIEEGLWTGLGFLGTPSPVTGAAKKAAGYAQSKLPIYINPNYAKNQIRSQYPLFTNTTLSKMASNEPLIKYPILGSTAGLTAGLVSAAFNNNNISHKERVQYRKLLSKQRRGEPLTNQEAAYLDNYDDKIQDISNQNVNTILTSIGVGGLSGLAYGIGARNLNALRNFKNYGRESWSAQEAQALSTIDPERSLRLMEARNNYWSNQPRVMTLEESELLNFYGQGKAGDYIHPPKERVSIFGEVQPRPTLQRSSSQNPPDDLYDYYSTEEYRLQEQLDRERMAANYTDRPQGFNISRNENPNYVISTPTPQPRVRNRSGLTKEEVLQKATSKDKEVLSKMTDQEFQSTVLKPTGEIVSYELNLASPFGKSEPPLSLSTKDYVNEFNSRLDLLNDIIAKKNKTGIEYKVTGLTEGGRLMFETPSMPGATKIWSVGITPGQWRGQIEDIANTEYFRNIPGLEMRNTSSSVFGDMTPRKGSGAYESINEYLKALDLGRLKPGFNSQTDFSRSAWENFIKSGRGVGFYGNPSTVYGIMKTTIPIGLAGAAALKQKQQGGMLVKPSFDTGVQRTDATKTRIPQSVKAAVASEEYNRDLTGRSGLSEEGFRTKYNKSRRQARNMPSSSEVIANQVWEGAKVPFKLIGADPDLIRKNPVEGISQALAGTLMAELPVNEMYQATKQGISGLKKALGTESGLLSRTYKVNPWAFKPNPEAYYRGIGRTGLDDALESGVLRTPQGSKYGNDLYLADNLSMAEVYSQNQIPWTIDLEGNVVNLPTPKNFDNARYIAEIPKNKVTVLPKHGRSVLITNEQIPVDKVSLLKQDWLRGYKEVPKRTSSFKSEIDWAKWNSETPKHKVLMDEYNAIEESTTVKPFLNFTKESLDDAKGFLKRRQFIKQLQNERLIGKEFNIDDLNYAARSTDKTNKLTQLALNRNATRYRGVQGEVPAGGIGYNPNTGGEFNMSRPAWGNEISEFENMAKAGVDFNDPISIAKYQATHVPMQQYGYRSGIGDYKHIDALYTSFSPTNYGNYQIRMTVPRDYSKGNYQDWFDRYYNPNNNLQSIGLQKGYTSRDFIPDVSYENPMTLSKLNPSVVGRKGQKMFDVDENFPFINYKNLTPTEQAKFEAYKRKLSQDFNTGWRGQYQQGGKVKWQIIN